MSAEEWDEKLKDFGFAEPARYAIVESWARCAGKFGNRDLPARYKKVTSSELARRIKSSALLLEIATPHLHALHQRLFGETHVVYLTDADGIILYSLGDRNQIETFGLAPGFDWSESTMGTNGAGTALARAAPIAVVGDEHYLRAFENCTCTAAPVFGPTRELIGAVDASSSVVEATPERLSSVITLAREIESELYKHWQSRLR